MKKMLGHHQWHPERPENPAPESAKIGHFHGTDAPRRQKLSGFLQSLNRLAVVLEGLEKCDHGKFAITEIRVLNCPNLVGGVFRVEGMFEPPEIETMDDEGEGFTQFHNLVVDFDSDLPELERIYNRVESQLPKQICVAIDSIEALAEKYGIPEGRLINMLHKDLVENTNTYLVIVLEKHSNLDLDYYVDGVILLENAEVDGRAYREIFIQKLRGCETRHHRYLYTLTEGRENEPPPLELTRGVPLKGRVVDARGSAVARARIVVSGPAAVPIQFSENDGRFSLPPLPAGRYRVHAVAQLDGDTRESQVVDVELSVDKVPPRVDLAFE